MSSITYLPLGFKSEMNGTLSDTLWKSSRVKSRPHDFAMAIRCNTALVEPPVAMMRTMAFSKAARVIISRGLMSFFMSSRR